MRKYVLDVAPRNANDGGLEYNDRYNWQFLRMLVFTILSPYQCEAYLNG